jgi:DNA-binding response OmpR family regulator
MNDLDVECGDMYFGTSYQEFYRGGRLIHLTSTEGRILCNLMKNAGRLVAYADLARAIWGNTTPVLKIP